MDTTEIRSAENNKETNDHKSKKGSPLQFSKAYEGALLCYSK